MIHFAKANGEEIQFRGAILDVDDTLLDNKPGELGQGLHERSRLSAVHEVGRIHDLPELFHITLQQNYDAFHHASVHSLEAAVWNILLMAGIADTETINPTHPLLLEIVAFKNNLHKDIILNGAEEVPGSTAFVQYLDQHGLQNRLAVASTGIRSEIDLYLGKVGLLPVFGERIFTKESVTHPKPNPEVFNKAFASLDLPEQQRSSVLVVEDDPRGIMGAKAAGMFVGAIATRYTKQELQALEVAPDVVAERYEDFYSLLNLR